MPYAFKINPHLKLHSLDSIINIVETNYLVYLYDVRQLVH